MLASPAKAARQLRSRAASASSLCSETTPARKAGADPAFELRRQVDFRHQQQDLPAGRQRRSISRR
jgi:hypothetical protein